MGQNLAIIWSTIPLADDDGDFPSRIQNWFNEVQKYAWGAQWSPATGHYSQVSVFFLLSLLTVNFPFLFILYILYKSRYTFFGILL